MELSEPTEKEYLKCSGCGRMFDSGNEAERREYDNHSCEENEFGECDKCGGQYELGSREGRCGDCGNCSVCCDHSGTWVCPTCHYECHQDIAKAPCGSCGDCHSYHHGNCQVYHEKEIA